MTNHPKQAFEQPRALRSYWLTSGLSGEQLAPATPTADAWQRWGPILLIAALTFVAYIPSLSNGFVSWDDDHYIYKNHQVHYDDGIYSIWFDVFKHSDRKFQGDGRREDRVSHQYYPMVFTLYWLEFRMHKWFGNADPDFTIEENIEQGNMSAMSFHLVSVVLHLVNVMLLIFCFRQLGVSNWVAWAATILFALHPMQVATVAWAAERKNIIALLFYLLALMSYIKMRREGKWWRYILALVLFQAALFSKTVSLTLPIMLFFTDRLLERRSEPHAKLFSMISFLLMAGTLIFLLPLRPGDGANVIDSVMYAIVLAVIAAVLVGLTLFTWPRQLALASILRIAPFVILSGIAAATTIKVEDRNRTIELEDQQRPLVAGAAAWFYPVKMLVPTNQSPVYPLWEPDNADILWYLPLLGAFVAGGMVIALRSSISPPFKWAMLMYIITMLPMLAFKNINYFQFAYVADHYFYHGAVGLFLMLAIILEWLRRRFLPEHSGRIVATTLVCLAAVACGARTFAYSENWRDSEAFWERTLTMNPRCWPGWFNTGNARKRDALQISQRLQTAEITEAQREDLRVQRDAIVVQLETEDLSARKRRQLQLKAEELRKRIEEPNLTPEKHAELKQKRADLLADAAERYMRVADIHKKIVQPFEQLISIRKLQGDWPGVYDAAVQAASRFGHQIVWWEEAGKAGLNAKMYAASADAFKEAAIRYEKAGKLQKAMSHYINAAAAAKRGKLDERTRENYEKGGDIGEVLGKQLAGAGNDCKAADTFRLAAQCYAVATRLAPTDARLKQQLDEMITARNEAQQRCPQ